jgi:hypothetical protein
MRFKYFAIAVALAATAASAAPVIESTEPLTAKLNEGHLNHEAMEKRYYTPRLSVRKRSPDALVEAPIDEGHLNHEAMEKRYYTPRLSVRKRSSAGRPPHKLLKRAEAPENKNGNPNDNTSDREVHPDNSRRTWHGPGSDACIDKSRGCYVEE